MPSWDKENQFLIIQNSYKIALLTINKFNCIKIGKSLYLRFIFNESS